VNEPSAIALIAVGVLVGVFSGLMGLGGGSVMIPVMVLAFGMTQQKAHGTSLAVMIPPVALPAVIEYWRNGNVDWRVALWMAAGVAVGTFFGAVLANRMSVGALKLVFGFLLIYVAGYTIFGRERVGRSVALAGVTVLFAVLLWAAVTWYDRRYGVAAAADPHDARPGGFEVVPPPQDGQGPSGI
jgi:uncharacterized membrane protein YfcA